MTSRSSSPRRTLSISAAHSTRSSRESGNRRPLGVPPIAWPERPTRCRKVAIERGEPIWQTRLTSPMSMPSSSEAVATSALSSPRFSRCSAASLQLLGHAAVMGGDGGFAEAVGELARDAFGHPPRVDEHERRAVLGDEFGQARVDFRPHFVRHHRFERRTGNLEAQIALALMARVDDRDFCGGLAVRVGAGEEMGDGVESDSASRRGRCAAGGRRTEPRASPATRRDGRRACWARPRGFRRRSPSGRSPASRARTASRAGRRAIPASSPGCAAGGGASARARPRACRRF